MTFIKVKDKWYSHRCNGKNSDSQEFRNFCLQDCKNCKLSSSLLNLNTWGREDENEEIDDGLVWSIISGFQ